jgi:hypothetical protein
MSDTELFWIMFGSISGAVGSFAAAVGLIFAGKQLLDSKKISRGEFLLRLDELFQQHVETQMRLRPGGDWSSGDAGPEKASEWGSVERYMGLFERIQVLMDAGIIDLATVDHLYGYRVLNIAKNPVIRREKLEGPRAKYWLGFIRLWKALEERRAGREVEIA